MKKGIISKLISALISALVIFIAFWFELPPINLRSPDFWGFLIFCVVATVIIFCGAALIKKIKNGFSDELHFDVKDPKSALGILKSKSTVAIGIKAIIITLALWLVVNVAAFFTGLPLFNASAYHGLLKVTDGNFSEDVAELDMSSIPVVDRDTASRLGKRKLGEMNDLVSQFEITEDYTQINYKNSPYRVTTLAYGDLFKWFNNQEKGIPAYITVDMVTQETTLVRLEEGIKYSEGEYFMRNIHRYLRFNYPTKIFDQLEFEIDENGTPYWIAPCITYRIGIWSGKDIEGAVLVNAITGESNFYSLEEIPEWVDQVFISSLVIEQLNYYGLYGNGFFNSIFGQQGVIETTRGYNYLAIDNDVWLYTGMTSVAGDESNIGFVLVNMRTKETRYYSIPGAEEYSAMGSAEGQVQHLKYSSTFPILLNVSDRPTYFVSLKDAAGLVKMYAFVDVERYQIVGTGETVEKAKQDYASKLDGEDITTPDEKETDITVSDVRFPVINGESKAYILDSNGEIWVVPVSLDSRLAFIKSGDVLSVKYTEYSSTKTIISITEIK